MLSDECNLGCLITISRPFRHTRQTLIEQNSFHPLIGDLSLRIIILNFNHPRSYKGYGSIRADPVSVSRLLQLQETIERTVRPLENSPNFYDVK
jgi:hypothetical protein